jgi:hypothetical protein
LKSRPELRALSHEPMEDFTKAPGKNILHDSIIL